MFESVEAWGRNIEVFLLRVREKECVCVWVCVRERDIEKVGESLYVCAKDGESVCVCMRERQRGRKLCWVCIAF